jgi:hypothetical protein
MIFRDDQSAWLDKRNQVNYDFRAFTVRRRRTAADMERGWGGGDTIEKSSDH